MGTNWTQMDMVQAKARLNRMVVGTQRPVAHCFVPYTQSMGLM